MAMELQEYLGRKIKNKLDMERFDDMRPRVSSASSSLNDTKQRGAGTDRPRPVNDFRSPDNRINAVSLVSMVDSAISSMSDFMEIVKSASEKSVSDVHSFFFEQKSTAERREETKQFFRQKVTGNETIAPGSFETDIPHLNMLESRLYQKRKGMQQRLGNNSRCANINESTRKDIVTVRSTKMASDETMEKEVCNLNPPEIQSQDDSNNNNNKHEYYYDQNTKVRHWIERHCVLGRKDSLAHEGSAGFERLSSKDSNLEKPAFEKRQCFENFLCYAEGKTCRRLNNIDLSCVNNEVCIKRCDNALNEFRERMGQMSAEDVENHEDERTYKYSPHTKKRLVTSINKISDLEMKYVMTKSYVFTKAMQPTSKNVSVLHIAVQYLLVTRRIKVTVEKVTNSNAVHEFTIRTKSFIKLNMLLNDRLKAKKTKKQHTNGNDEIDFKQDLYFNNFTVADAHLVSLRFRLFRKRPNFLRGSTSVGEAVAFLDDVDIVGQAKFALPLIPFD